MCRVRPSRVMPPTISRACVPAEPLDQVILERGISPVKGLFVAPRPRSDGTASLALT
uniref:Uncharacterized protein n=1 Tax=Cucumis melo TaxID=3656 RepID=A0A9I9EFV8_CUCME